ncbi:MAG: radical SAM protein [Deltaproteobacteria bacterium]|nr:radical SAM protein [Deltaproteobacteria bacterium]
MKALIKVGYGCNDHCTFCHTLEVRHIDGTAAEVSRKIARARALGHTMVVLSGGEPTIRPELVRWAGEVAALGMDFGLVTNGRLLSYPDVVAQLLARRLRYVYLSLHGGSATIHNRLVRTDAFAQSYGALAELSGRGLDLKVNCVVTLQNVDHLRELVDALRPYPDVTLKFSMVEPKGGGKALFASLMPRVADAAAKVVDAIDYGLAQAPAQRFAHGGFPLCLMPGHEARYADLRTDQYWSMTEIGEPDFFPVDDRNKLQPDEKCRDCALRGGCPGLYRGYHEAFGAAELRPRTGGLRANSFNYTFEAKVRTSPDDARCPIERVGPAPWDRGRHLFVANGPHVARFRADTRDFSDEEIVAIKHDREQLYLDVSDKPAPDDFATDLVKLMRSPRCAGCTAHDGCTGLYGPAADEVFERDDALVRDWLGALRGDVLDVGCGAGGRYDAILAPLVARGAIRYVGVEPDLGHAEVIARTRPWIELRRSTLEELGTVERFDHVLALRSWNHFADRQDALGKLVALCRPGGVLTIVDNVAFGLVRTRAQSARAEAGPARFEHYRNDDVDAVLPLAAAMGLERLALHPVTRTSSNQWAVRYRTPRVASASA